jgi:hypothetical protein
MELILLHMGNDHRETMITDYIKHISFPRYAKQLFWSIEALLRDKQDRDEALLTANRPSQTELYLFLQPFLQSIPQAFLQLYIMLAHYQLDKHISKYSSTC